MNLRERFQKLGLTTDSMVARIEGVNKSVTDNGTWFTFVAFTLINGKFEPITCKLNAGKANDEHVKNVEQFFNDFKAGDYQLTNLGIRVQGDTWEDAEQGTKGVYKQSYVNIPFPSDMIYLGTDAVKSMKQREVELKRLEMEALAQVME